mmetsp:Transcript_10145/g.31764  ORF Transcript_10145/g.31764 Transcript_10145/m.31764 type:complete len:373 (+) Transcript_10145:472-1590(+)
MTWYCRTSTRASSAAFSTAGGTPALKVSTRPSEAAARSMSERETSPGAASRKRSRTRSCGSSASAVLIASVTPAESTLSTTLMRCSSCEPSSVSTMVRASETRSWPACAASRFSRASASLALAAALASLSVLCTVKMSPASGTPLRPTTVHAIDGLASSRRLPYESVSARTRADTAPTLSESPTFSVPFCTTTVAVAPEDFSRRASTTVPLASAVGLALSSAISEVSASASSRSSTPSPVLELSAMKGTSPPHSSGVSPTAARPFLAFSMSAPSLSILVMATTMGTPAACACATASSVCGRTPSSAAHTITAMSVTRAPRARMALKASWPGVSRKTTGCGWSDSPIVTSARYAPMPCVIPPASPSATFSWRM